eukprot:Nk52_evm40s212 gene=Nk52_evmTU40s212
MDGEDLGEVSKDTGVGAVDVQDESDTVSLSSHSRVGSEVDSGAGSNSRNDKKTKGIEVGSDGETRREGRASPRDNRGSTENILHRSEMDSAANKKEGKKKKDEDVTRKRSSGAGSSKQRHLNSLREFDSQDLDDGDGSIGYRHNSNSSLLQSKRNDVPTEGILKKSSVGQGGGVGVVINGQSVWKGGASDYASTDSDEKQVQFERNDMSNVADDGDLANIRESPDENDANLCPHSSGGRRSLPRRLSVGAAVKENRRWSCATASDGGEEFMLRVHEREEKWWSSRRGGRFSATSYRGSMDKGLQGRESVDMTRTNSYLNVEVDGNKGRGSKRPSILDDRSEELESYYMYNLPDRKIRKNSESKNKEEQTAETFHNGTHPLTERVLRDKAKAGSGWTMRDNNSEVSCYSSSSVNFKRLAASMWVRKTFYILLTATISLIPGVFFRIFSSSTTIADVPVLTWSIMLAIMFISYLVAKLIVFVLIVIVELLFVVSNANVIYYIFGIRKPLRWLLWSILALCNWLFTMSYNYSKGGNSWEPTESPLNVVLRAIVCLIITFVTLTLKAFLVKRIAIAYHKSAYFDRMQAGLFAEYTLSMLSKPKKQTRTRRNATVDMPRSKNASKPGDSASSAHSNLTSQNDKLFPDAKAKLDECSASFPESHHILNCTAPDKDPSLGEGIGKDPRGVEDGSNGTTFVDKTSAMVEQNSTSMDGLSISIQDIDEEAAAMEDEAAAITSSINDLGQSFTFPRRETNNNNSSSDAASFQRPKPQFEDNSSSNESLNINMDVLNMDLADISNLEISRMMSHIKNRPISSRSLLYPKLTSMSSKSDDNTNKPAKAAQLARRLFKSIKKPDAEGIVYLDFVPYFPKESLSMRAFELFDTTGDRTISRREMVEAVQKIFKERKSLAYSLTDSKSIVGSLDNVLTCMCFVGLFFVYLIIFRVEIVEIVVALSTILAVLTVGLSSTIKSIYEATIFIFVVHPFDVGDRIELPEGGSYVTSVHLQFTEFDRWDGQKIYYGNDQLRKMSILNYNRSEDMWDILNFEIGNDTPNSVIAIIEARIGNYLEDHELDWYPKFDFVILRIENSNKICCELWLRQRRNFQQMGLRYLKRSQFLLVLKDILEDLEVSYTPLEQNVKLKGSLEE